MPEGNPIAGLYPQPPASGSGSLLSDPLGPIDAISRLQQVSLLGRTLAARQAIGDAYSQNLNPDGSPDLPGVAASLKNNPQAAFGMQEAASTLLAQRGQQISNDTSAFNQFAGQSGFVQQWLASRANNPDVSKEDILNDVVTLARNTDPRVLPSSVLNSVASNILDDPKGPYAGILNTRNRVMGAAAAASRTPGPPSQSGQPTSVSLGATSAAPMPTGLPPGQAEAIGANRAAFVNDQTQSASIMAGLRPLQNALPLIAQLGASNFGPGSQGFADVKGALTTAGIIAPNTTDLDVRQEVNKYLKVYAGASRAAGRSDEGLQQAIASTPNLDLTKSANLGLIVNQVGMDRQTAAMPLAFGVEHPGESAKAAYNDYRAGYYPGLDQRAFSFDLATPQERRSIIDSLGKPTSQAYQKFQRSYAIAKQTGMLTPQNASQ